MIRDDFLLNYFSQKHLLLENHRVKNLTRFLTTSNDVKYLIYRIFLSLCKIKFLLG